MKLSFIVPVYNVEPYLRKCVDSLLLQDYDAYEIILVDDGSPDKCPQICDEYAEKNSNIHVIHQKNGGLSVARNEGVLEATGEYICFVDSDDYWQPNVLGALMKQVECEQLDVLRFDYQKVIIDSTGLYERQKINDFVHVTDTENIVVDGETYLSERMSYMCIAVQFIIKKNLVCPFKPGIHLEDAEWMPRMMVKAQRVNSTPKVVYNYLIREGSITQTNGEASKIRKNIEGRMAVVETLSELIRQYPHIQWLRCSQGLFALAILTSVAQEFYPERNDYITQLSNLGVFPLAKIKMSGKISRRILEINCLSPQIFCSLIHLRKLLKRG